jgi:hypothetical protein
MVLSSKEKIIKLKLIVMKNFANLTLDVLSTEELMAVRGGEAPTDPIIIRGKTDSTTVMTLSIGMPTTKK